MGKFGKEFAKGLIISNPVFVLALGLCPTLAISTSIDNALGMTLAVLIVLLGANVIISLIRRFVPNITRIPIFIVIIASFVTMVELFSQAYFYPIYQKLGIFIPLIVVNCIILGRAEAFASRNGMIASALDGLGIGLGYTMSLVLLGSIREILGAGTIFGVDIMWASFRPFTFMAEAPGAFVSLGLLLGIMNAVSKKS